jgi:hypothetical protein
MAGWQWEHSMWQDSAGRHGTSSKTCVALTRHTPKLRTPHGQNAAFTRRGMENPQVSGHADGQGWAPCKTVGLAYVGSNPTPATTCGNGPWPGVLPTSRAAALGPLMSRCVHASPAASGCARTHSGQRPGWTSGPPNRLLADQWRGEPTMAGLQRALSDALMRPALAGEARLHTGTRSATPRKRSRIGDVGLSGAGVFPAHSAVVSAHGTGWLSWAKPPLTRRR